MYTHCGVGARFRIDLWNLSNEVAEPLHRTTYLHIFVGANLNMRLLMPRIFQVPQLPYHGHGIGQRFIKFEKLRQRDLKIIHETISARRLQNKLLYVITQAV